VKASKVAGASGGYIIMRHMLPNSLTPIIVALTFGIPTAIFTEAAISQQQRVFLARALVQDADVLLLDEPMTGVDLATEETIGTLMRELRDAGTTVVYATHDLETAADISDLLCFVNGRIVAFGPPADTFTPHTLHETFGGELMIVDAGDHAHVHGGGHHGHVDVPKR
jgi:ABC-type cobalamin/Fe3+-siderophores transport system ATPase subunit